MTKNLIITVFGKTTGYGDLNFHFKGKQGKEYLVTTFFKECIGKKETHQLFFLPHTLFESREEIEGILVKDKNFTIKLIPSIVTQNEGIFKYFNFNASYGYIQYLFFLHLVDYYLKNPTLENLYVDISIGLNIYIDALKEAARSFKVFSDLLNFTKDKKVNLYLLFSDPAIPDRSSIKQIYTEIINTKIWFASPLKQSEINETNLTSIGLNKEQINLLKAFYYTYYSLYRNAPLIITTFGYHKKDFILSELKKIIENELIQFDINETTIRNGGYTIPSNIKLRQAAILSFALYKNIAEELEKSNISNLPSGMISLSKIENFSKIYDKYQLNANKELLERDISKLKEKSYKLITGKIVKIAELDGVKEKKKIYKRNFYAHSGFEANITYVSKSNNNELKIGYDTDYRNRLKELIFQ